MESSTSLPSRCRQLSPIPGNDGNPTFFIVISTSPALRLKPPLHVPSVNISTRVLVTEGGTCRSSLVTPLLTLLGSRDGRGRGACETLGSAWRRPSGSLMLTCRRYHRLWRRISSWKTPTTARKGPQGGR